MGLIRILGIFLIIYLAMQLISRYLLPWAAKYFVKKASEGMQERMRTREDGEKIYQEGEVTIRKTAPKSDNSSSSEDGEYVDYEEV